MISRTEPRTGGAPLIGIVHPRLLPTRGRAATMRAAGAMGATAAAGAAATATEGTGAIAGAWAARPS